MAPRNGTAAVAVEPVARTRGRNGNGHADREVGVKFTPPTQITIPAPNLKIVSVTVIGTAPYVQNKFAAKAAIMATQQEGSTAKSKKKRDPKDFDALYKAAQHIAVDGWHGQPAAGYRNSMIEACRLVGYHMTKAKMSVFIIEDGFDSEGTPLIRMTGKPERIDSHVRNDSGVIDIRARPMWKKWSSKIRIRYDADQFKEVDVINLLSRAGQQVGIGEGRPFSKDSCGMGWGTFEIEG
jgi:hypothetical protein